MIVATPRGFLLKWYELTRDEIQLGGIRLSFFGESAGIAISDDDFSVKRKGLMGPFELIDSQRQVVCSAKKHFSRSFDVTLHGSTMTLAADDSGSRRFSLVHNGAVVGTVFPKGWFRKRAVADLPSSIPPPAQAFLITLVLFMWKRSTGSDGGDGGDSGDGGD